MFDQVQYNRDRANKAYADFCERRAKLLTEVFDNTCFACGLTALKHMHLHHVEYDAIESNYPRHSRNFSDRKKRLEEAEQHPERFRLLCAACHRTIEGIKAMMDKAGITKERVLELLAT